MEARRRIHKLGRGALMRDFLRDKVLVGMGTTSQKHCRKQIRAMVDAYVGGLPRPVVTTGIEYVPSLWEHNGNALSCLCISRPDANSIRARELQADEDRRCGRMLSGACARKCPMRIAHALFKAAAVRPVVQEVMNGSSWLACCKS